MLATASVFLPLACLGKWKERERERERERDIATKKIGRNRDRIGRDREREKGRQIWR